MRVLVCGSRNFEDMPKLRECLKEIMGRVGVFSEIIEGGARGADSLAGIFAREQKINLRIFWAQWDKYGKAAGPIRNAQMLKEGKPELVVAFRYPNSRGTQNMIDQAQKAGIPVEIVDLQ